jgi:SDR family mycofactocin-dependent oxidoreductase
MAEGRLAGRVAFVTGAARGQGRAHAVRMAQEGADLIICDICTELETTSYPGAVPSDLAETATLVGKEGRRAVARAVDVRDFEGLESLVHDGVAELGRLDIVVANAGIDSANLSWEITSEQWDELVGINLKGVWQTAKAAIPTLIAQGTGGSIILTSSTAGRKGLPFKAHYSAAKHGVVGLCGVLAAELGEYDIRVNTIHPAGVATAMVTDPHLHEHAAPHVHEARGHRRRRCLPGQRRVPVHDRFPTRGGHGQYRSLIKVIKVICVVAR